MKIYGRNPVEEALKAGRTVDRLMAARGLKDSGAQRIIDEAKSRGIRVAFYDKEVLDREAEGKKHQGFIAEITDFEYCEIGDILAEAERRGEPPLVLVLDGVEDPHNLGSILRVAECAGVHGVIIPRHRSVSVNDTVVKVSAGAAAHVLVAKVVNVNTAIDYLKEHGVWVYAADMDGDSIYAANITGACAFVIGGEGSGVKRLTREKCDGVLSLPVRGKVNSLNASVAAAVVVYEYVRRNYVK